MNDGVDSEKGENDFTPLRNLFNEWYARDTSKKIRAVFRAKGTSGKRLSSQPVYGYVADENGDWQEDPETAPVVREIFALFLAGQGPAVIARMLTDRNVPTPAPSVISGLGICRVTAQKRHANGSTRRSAAS